MKSRESSAFASQKGSGLPAGDYIVFTEKVKTKTGIDLSLYKEDQMKRRLKTFYEKKGFSSFVSFFDDGLMKKDELFHQFLERMTINVSEFYRNPSRWEQLEETIFPLLCKGSSVFKVWSAACSTGEEPYTISHMLNEAPYCSHYSILATDIDTNALLTAEKGIYTSHTLSAIHMARPGLLKKTEDGYEVSAHLRSKVTFKQLNLLGDAFDRQFDFISCRNVLIYFTESAKADLYRKFYHSLKDGGILFVGSTEQIFQPQQFGFETAGPFLYRKNTRLL
ncbi:chemotaxis protein methyltransferase CheR [Sinobaca qinghaiensis]|uniref:Chemotaxis protein methyltransferase CheR n=1 Tax=Sinobaca qinghaiensis TaxID=342944 RepID=A0A419V307_9BACL|nr:protein-glutamate O-methyltransferase CheR [Sinobaca qinghaiensis]RKD72854.1 chemotaxis protein methyltransferase CheR [Sinobaca qinghaiensis]